MGETSKIFDRLVFVYGTLKTGFCRNHCLQGYQRVGEAETEPVYRLFDCGDYPAMILDSNSGQSIAGEVWAVDDLAIQNLDQVEAVDSGLYQRVEIKLLDSYDSPVEGYLFLEDVGGLPDCGPVWTKGKQNS